MAPKSCEQNLDTCQYLCLVAAGFPQSKSVGKSTGKITSFFTHTHHHFTHSYPPALIFTILPAFVHTQASTSSLLPWTFLCYHTDMHPPASSFLGSSCVRRRTCMHLSYIPLSYPCMQVPQNPLLPTSQSSLCSAASPILCVACTRSPRASSTLCAAPIWSLLRLLLHLT